MPNSRKLIRHSLYLFGVPLLVFGLIMTGHGISGTTYDLEPEYARGLDIVSGLAIGAAGLILTFTGYLLKTKSQASSDE